MDPGTGCFLATSRLPQGSSVTIVDPNANVLAHVIRRLPDIDLTIVQADVRRPLPITGLFEVRCPAPRAPLPARADSEAGIRAILEVSFRDVRLETVGSIAVFEATGPRR